MIVYCADRILLSISLTGSSIVEFCQQRALEWDTAGGGVLSSWWPAESVCCRCGRLPWSALFWVLTRPFLGDLVSLSWPCDNLPGLAQRMIPCGFLLVGVSCLHSTGSLRRSLGRSDCLGPALHVHTPALLATCTPLTPQRVRLPASEIADDL